MNQIDVDSPENISISQPAHHPEVKPDAPVVPVSTSSTDYNVTSSVYYTSSNMSAILTLSTSPDSSTPAAMNNKTTTTHINVYNLSDSSEYDISNNTLSGIEELSLTQNDSTCTSDVHKGESSDNSDHCDKISETQECTDSPQKNRIDSNEKNEYYQCEKKCEHKPLPRRKGQAFNDPSQVSIITMFNAMKRKLTPGKEEDTPREHLKIQRNEPTNI